MILFTSDTYFTCLECQSFSRFSRRGSVRQSKKMTKFASLKRDGSFEKYRDKSRKAKFTDFTCDGKLPTTAVKKRLSVSVNRTDEEVDLNKVRFRNN